MSSSANVIDAKSDEKDDDDGAHCPYHTDDDDSHQGELWPH